jgi:hypothetical protein
MRPAIFEAHKRRVSALSLLGSQDEPSLSALEPEFGWLRLLGGQTLCRASNVAGALSVVLAGCPSVTASSSGRDVSITNGRTGDVVGEMALLGGGLRSATIAALRDTELLATVIGEVVSIAICAQADILFKFKLPVNLLDGAIVAGQPPRDRKVCAAGHIGVAGTALMETRNFLNQGVGFALAPSRNRSVVPLLVATITAIRRPLA